MLHKIQMVSSSMNWHYLIRAQIRLSSQSQYHITLGACQCTSSLDYRKTSPYFNLATQDFDWLPQFQTSSSPVCAANISFG